MTSTPTSSQSVISVSPPRDHPNAFWLPAFFFPQGNVKWKLCYGRYLLRKISLDFVQVAILSPSQTSIKLSPLWFFCSSFKRPKIPFCFHPKTAKICFCHFSCLHSREKQNKILATLNLTVFPVTRHQNLSIITLT